MKTKTKKLPRFNTYDREFKQKVILYAEQQSTREAQRKYGIPESNVRRWRRLKETIFAKDPSSSISMPVLKKKDKKKKHSKKNSKDLQYKIENIMLEDYEYNDSSSLDSVPLTQRISNTNANSVSTPVDQLQSQPLSPTKLKVTRQSAPKTPKFLPIAPKPTDSIQNCSNEEVCLRWNSHHNNMQTSFPYLMKKEQFVDVTLVAEGKMLKCHKVILSSCSSYFESILESIEHNQHPVIFLKDIPFWILKSLTDFMYVGEVNIIQNRLQELLQAAEVLKIKGLAGKTNNAQDSPTDTKLETQSPPTVYDPVHRSSFPPVLEPQTVKPQLKSTNLKRNEEERRSSTSSFVKPAVLPLEQIPITDPLELLEPIYQEETRSETEPANVVKKDLLKIARKSISKKLRKRKSPEIDESLVFESQPPIRLRRGTRSRPNVKVPKYYHNAFEAPVEETDPLSNASTIKTEPIDLDFEPDIRPSSQSILTDPIERSSIDPENILITGIEDDNVVLSQDDAAVSQKKRFVTENVEKEEERSFIGSIDEETTENTEESGHLEEETGREEVIDIEETVLQTMDSTSSRVSSSTPQEEKEPPEKDDVDTVKEKEPEEQEIKEKEEENTEKINEEEEDEQQHQQQQQEQQRSPERDTVANFQITEVMSLNTEENEDSLLMDIEENKFLENEYGKDEETKEEDQLNDIETNEIEDRLLENA